VVIGVDIGVVMGAPPFDPLDVISFPPGETNRRNDRAVLDCPETIERILTNF